MKFQIGDTVTWSQMNGLWIVTAVHDYNLTIICSGETHIALKAQCTKVENK